ncbi:hypothetical protein L873DRAFT_1070285 [Choiromyces venosus 120613-1]|uniref:Uncharacterized protein n=1 Tax=Choiromyces venosus 120613-1 TaxID=1336337 RepID=A0A3N4K337_9PEZI|nr:hypothetical protein L873DRAFT_1070285 [Choiromyces venosus 120613-1]
MNSLTGPMASIRVTVKNSRFSPTIWSLVLIEIVSSATRALMHHHLGQFVAGGFTVVAGVKDDMSSSKTSLANSLASRRGWPILERTSLTLRSCWTILERTSLMRRSGWVILERTLLTLERTPAPIL